MYVYVCVLYIIYILYTLRRNKMRAALNFIASGGCCSRFCGVTVESGCYNFITTTAAWITIAILYFWSEYVLRLIRAPFFTL